MKETNTREHDQFLQKVKRSLMIPTEETYADDEINLHINACEVLLTTVGIPSSVAKSDNALVEGLILTYVKTFFGFKNDGSVRELPSNFEILLRQLSLTVGEDA